MRRRRIVEEGIHVTKRPKRRGNTGTRSRDTGNGTAAGIGVGTETGIGSGTDDVTAIAANHEQEMAGMMRGGLLTGGGGVAVQSPDANMSDGMTRRDTAAAAAAGRGIETEIETGLRGPDNITTGGGVGVGAEAGPGIAGGARDSPSCSVLGDMSWLSEPEHPVPNVLFICCPRIYLIGYLTRLGVFSRQNVRTTCPRHTRPSI